MLAWLGQFGTCVGCVDIPPWAASRSENCTTQMCLELMDLIGVRGWAGLSTTVTVVEREMWSYVVIVVITWSVLAAWGVRMVCLGCLGLQFAEFFAEFANLSWFARRCAERKHLKFVCNLGQAISCPVDDKGHGQGRYSESSCDRSDKSLWHVWEILRTIVWICLNVWIFMSDQLRLARLVVSEWVAVSRRALDLPVISVILYNCGRRARAHLGIAVPFLWAESQGVFMDVFAVTLPMEAWLVSLQPAHLDFIHSCVESACSSENSGKHDACCNSVNDWIAGFKSVISCKLQSDCSHNFPYLCECWNRVEMGLGCSTWSTR